MHEIILEEPAKQFVRSLNKTQQEKLLDKIELLKNNPKLGRPLKGKLFGLRSLRVDEFRVIYTVRDIGLVVVVIKIGHRKNVYD